MSMCRFLIGASLALAAHVSADPFSVGFYYDSACSANAFNLPVTTISGDGLSLCEPVNGTLANAQYYSQSTCSNEVWKVEFYKDMNCTVKALASAGSSASNDCVDSGNFGAMHVYVRGQCDTAATTNTPTSTSTPSPSSSSSPTTIAPSSSSSSSVPSTTASTSTSTPTPTTQPTSSSASDTPAPTTTTTPTPTQVESSSPSTSAEPSTTSAPIPTVTSTTAPPSTLPSTSSPSPSSSSSSTPTTTLKPTKTIKFSSATIASSVTLNTVWMLIGIGAAALAGIMTS